MKFQIVAKLPTMSVVKNLAAMLRNFSINLYKLADYAFPNITLSTANGGIMADVSGRT